MVTVSSYFSVQILVMFCITVRVPCFGFSAATDESERICQQLQCENNSSCRVRTENEKSQAECMCHGEWAGKRCEGVLHLATEAVKSSAAVFSVLYQIPPSSYPHNSSAKNDILSDFQFTVHYWTFNGSNFMCSILPNIHRRTFTILGLQPRTIYNVCVRSVHVDRCFPSPDLVKDNLTRNCIKLVTQNSTAETENQDGPPVYAIPLSVALAVVLLVTVVLLVIFFKLKKGKGVCITNTKNTRERHCSSDTNPELLLLTGTPPTPHLTISTPSSSAKRKYKQSKTGPRYTAFNSKTKESITLATVIEYTPEVSLEEPENEIMEMTTFRGRKKLAVLNENQ
ncbi:hypothetical protein CHS0354_021987 [Potamilus streckersoni]|uniref:EGF-like domain-containing protein n=1 Tax=Potamilus streckersoni TaxID=2493646 RepID=A0AAE0SJX5_9BIVA|nr:hypothetical protein CHS0354_021987 [Potamilus streckersoni]